MRKSSVGWAVLGLLAVTVASIGATAVLMLLPFSNDLGDLSRRRLKKCK